MGVSPGAFRPDPSKVIMLFLVVFLTAMIVAIVLGVMSGWSDFRGMTIPNTYALGILLAFIFAFTACALSNNPQPFQPLMSHVIAGGVAFVITFTMTLLKLMGGGDSKLITVFSFWMGVKYVALFLFIMASAGALLAVLAILVKKFKPFKTPREGGWIARAQAGQPVIPYGIPIALAGLVVFVEAQYLSMPVLKGFLEQIG